MIIPILLCGGSGTRLWPLSRKSYPKQFLPLTGEDTLFQTTLRRLSGDGFAAPLILTNDAFRFIVAEQMADLETKPSTILIEPASRNTAPAILAAALMLEKTHPEALMLVAPSDHAIPDTEAFRETIAAGESAARGGRLVTFGIQPDRPETGYGYLELAASPNSETPAPVPLRRFVEKPSKARAEEMLASGKFLWNAGIFLFSVQSVLAAFRAHAPTLMEPVSTAVENATTDLGFLRLDPSAWEQADDVSVDYAIMEHAENLSAVPFAGKWSDLGGWDAVWMDAERDAKGVSLSGHASAIDCDNTLLRSEDSRVELVGIGLQNVVAVAMPDAVLVADLSRAQDVKTAVEVLKGKGATQATEFPKDHRPWGWFESLVIGDRFQVKRIRVHPGAALSLQSHHHRSEHWIVVEGTAKVTVDGEVKLVTENQSVYIPLGAVHRMENPGKVPMVLIEVQTGSYLGEDDILRYEDIYSRQ